MRCPNCKQNQFKPSRSMNSSVSTPVRMFWIRLRCYRCGTIKTAVRALWMIETVFSPDNTRSEVAADLVSSQKASSEIATGQPTVPRRAVKSSV